MKKCNYCHVSKPLDEFPLLKGGTYSGNCLSCKEKRKERTTQNKEIVSNKRKQYYENNKEKILEDRKIYYENNKNEVQERNRQNYEEHKEEYLKYKKEYYTDNKDHLLKVAKQDRIDNPEKFLFNNAKKRSKRDNLPFDITMEDIFVPNICPVLNIPITLGNSLEERDNSPSLDKIIPELGYVKGNIQVISFRANSLKRDGHIEDFEKIIDYINKYKGN